MRLNEHMPELEGASSWINGTAFRNDLIGTTPTLIHYWSISCETCKDTMPTIIQLKELFKGKLNIIAVHMPRSNEDKNLKEIKTIAREQGITHPIYVDDNLYLTKRMKTKYVPSYYLFDSNGKLRHYQSGSGGMKMLSMKIKRLVK